ncbi:right-handed parallel beta-helix repeat-containing protein [Paenibacillus sp. 1001270B_150601_E10]|uniref:right-handed parallel beta-helix repeat-containing protein n=1 Tax=Paenibacillus sp. 1001270B_150601_E10 TaxID=2787079 RepID=UPI00189E458B|nr:right-handed parallel beta-helix repeat-containing protein [Paenibacillus sp. 1001270B_150601_E10]
MMMKLRIGVAAIVVVAGVVLGLMIKAMAAQDVETDMVVSDAPTPIKVVSPAQLDYLDGLADNLKKINTTCKQKCINAKKRGVAANGKDMRASLQKLIDEASKTSSTVYLSSGTYSIKGVLHLRSNVTLIGDGDKTVLRQMQANKELISIENVRNVTLYNIKLDQSKVKHTTRESNHTVRIMNAASVQLNKLVIKGSVSKSEDEYGDAIYVAQKKLYSRKTEQIIAKDIIIDGASRNGIAVVGGQNMLFSDITLKNMNHRLNAALDIEPDSGAEVRNIKFQNVEVNNENIHVWTETGSISNIILDRVRALNGRLVIKGKVNNVLFSNGSAPYVTIEVEKDERLRPKNIKLLNSTFSNTKLKEVVFMSGENIAIENCIIKGGTEYGVRDVGMKGYFVLKNSQVYNSKGNGVFLYRAPQIELIGNQVSDNNNYGVMLGNTSKATVDTVVISGKNQFYNNGRDNIQIRLPKSKIYIGPEEQIEGF